MTPFLLILLSTLFTTSLTVSAQEIEICGGVSDAITQEGLHQAAVTIYDAANGERIGTGVALLQMVTEKTDFGSRTYPDKKNDAVFAIRVAARPRLRIVVEAEGHEPYEKTVETDRQKRRKRVDLGSIYLAPKAKERDLGEATVTATKLKFVYKGDTLVYNADAFNVAQTESLRKLVEQLPGVELKDGVISVHGKPVENLLIGGKDFFNGNIQAALDNLPAYVVKHLKVYNRAGELTELTGRDMHDERYVMDIQLKRQYIGIWLAKLEANAATAQFYGAQGMLMRFDDRQGLMINGDVNNFGQERQMMDMGNIATTYQNPRTTKVARLDYHFEPNYAWRFRLNGDVQRTDEDKDTWTNTETFLSPQNQMRREMKRSSADNTMVNASTALRLRKKNRWSHELAYTFGYQRTSQSVDAKSIAYMCTADNAWDNFLLQNADTIATGNGLQHLLLNPSRDKSTSLSQQADWTSAFTIGHSVLNVKTSLKHNTTDTDRFVNYRLAYFGESESEGDRQRRFYDRHNYTLNLNAKADYLVKYANTTRHDGHVTPFVNFIHDYGTASHPLYRLDRLTAWSDAHDWGMAALGILPDEDFRSLCIDEANSFHSLTGRNRGSIGGRLSHKIKMAGGAEWRLDANATTYYERRTLDYTRDGVLYPIRRSGLFFSPKITMRWENTKDTVRHWLPSLSLGYDGSPSMPNMTYFLPIRDNSDPLNLFLGNDALDNIYTHKANLRYAARHRRTKHEWFIQGAYSHVHNDVVMSSVYDAEKGSRTYRPENTNRTHRAEVATGYTLALDRKKQWYLTANLKADYYSHANLTSLTTAQARPHSLIENIGVTPQINLRFTVGKLNGQASWETRFTTVHDQNSTTDYRTTSGFFEANYTLPWGIGLNSSLKLSKNSGLSNRELNRTQACWNAALNKTILDGKLFVRISAHDILNKGGNIKQNITALARTETYTNFTPRYFMVSLISNLNWSKQKR